jgi:putative ABC transport system permease protein
MNAALLTDWIAVSFLPQRLAAMLTGIAGRPDCCSPVGLYGVTAYSVAQRTREFGMRMALDARPEDVMQLVMRQGIAVILLGTFTGGLAPWL